MAEGLSTYFPFLQVYFDQITTVLGVSTINLVAYTIGMVLYGIFIWHLYRFIARREIFPFRLQKYMSTERKILNAAAYILENLVIFPILVFLWFGLFSLFMFFLAKDLTVATVLLVSMALVATIRITSYYNEDLSKDIGKLIPFALLAIFLVAPGFFSIELVEDRIAEVFSFGEDILKFAAFTVTVEWVLRILYLIKKKILGDRKDLGKDLKKESGEELAK